MSLERGSRRVNYLSFETMDTEANPYNTPSVIDWPVSYPMPRPGSTVVDLDDEFIAFGNDKKGSYIDILKRNDLSGAVHWIPRSEDPYPNDRRSENPGSLILRNLEILRSDLSLQDRIDDIVDEQLGDVA